METALAESEREKLEFEKTRSQVEQLLTQLQVCDYHGVCIVNKDNPGKGEKEHTHTTQGR